MQLTRSGVAEKRVDVNACIICQEIKKVAPIGTAGGRSRVIKSVIETNDEVYQRIVTMNHFCITLANICYNPYILAKPPPFNEAKYSDSDTTEREVSNETMNLRSPDSTHEKPRSERKLWEIQCIICNKIHKNKRYEKHRLEQDNRAEKFIETTKTKMDYGTGFTLSEV